MMTSLLRRAARHRLFLAIGVGALLVAAGCVPTPQPTPKVSVSLTFDDNTPEHLLAGNLMAQRGVHGTFFINSGRVGSAGYLSWADIATLASQGHEIGGHTTDHLNLVNLSESAATTQVCGDRNNLVAQGYNPVSFAYPFAANNTAVEQIAANCGYTWGRDVGGLRTDSSCGGCPAIQEVPAPQPLVLRTNGSVRNTTTLDEMKSWVTQAEATGLTGTVPFVIHRICDNNCDTYSTTQAILEQFMDWLIARGTPMLTLSAALTPATAS
ncbi:MAG: polysaccharide deacetylase family protein [Microthrixaceae bacterium]